ncbi:lytic murein transglycosylase B [Rubrivivax gelatinosus]|nr:lytic murein transglycosylase B [Rubrivivax gelatinosus]
MPAPKSALASIALIALALAAPPAALAAEKPARKPATAKHAAAKKKPRAAPAAPLYGEREDLRRFAAELAERRGLDADWVAAQLAQARRLETVQRLVMPPPAGTAKDWAAYRARFVEPRRIAAGLAFWQEHEDALARAQARWGVPPEIVVGIIGVETFYGRIMGRFRIVDALATLAFDFPGGRSDRSPFFRRELEEFLVWSEREGRDPQEVRGSFAGAIGLPQFMPSNLNRLALDFDGDGHVDLGGNGVDAVGSVANFLAAHGWQPGLAATHAVAPPVDTAARARLLAPDIEPSFTPADFAAAGAELDAAGRAHTGLLALVELQNGAAAPSYVAGTANFRVLTRYNASSYYAMAVLALGDAVAQARAATLAAAAADPAASAAPR